MSSRHVVANPNLEALSKAVVSMVGAQSGVLSILDGAILGDKRNGGG